MNLKEYLWNQKIALLLELVLILILSLILSGFGINGFATAYVISIQMIFQILFFIYDYCRKREFCKQLKINQELLEQKNMISELIEEPDFLEGKLFYDCLMECNKSMNDEILKYKNQSSAYRDYVEMWIHEIKTPVAAEKLILENHPGEITKALEEEIALVDYYLDQALYYARSTSVEKDYMVKKLDLKRIVDQVIRTNAKMLIREKVKIQKEELSFWIFSDEKWIEFIINQVINNAVKYRKDQHPEIRFSGREEKEIIVLEISDNGIGISKKDLPMVMKKGYTGTIGRIYKKSTGMGLYLCYNLCEKLGIQFGIESEEGIGTTVKIGFPRNSMTFLRE